MKYFRPNDKLMAKGKFVNMKNKMFALVIQNPDVAIQIESKKLLEFGIPQSALDAGEMKGELKTVGMWHIPVSYRALCVSSVWDNSKGYTVRTSETIYGMRTLSKPTQSGYELEGRVSVNGRKVRGFTSSQLFQLENGKLVNIATIHACLNDKK